MEEEYKHIVEASESVEQVLDTKKEAINDLERKLVELQGQLMTDVEVWTEDENQTIIFKFKSEHTPPALRTIDAQTHTDVSVEYDMVNKTFKVRGTLNTTEITTTN